ncbi:MAG: sterol desaturase family protein [Polyangiaceae bacterium]
MMKATEDSPRMFENDLVDFFSRTHPMVVPIVMVPAASACMYWGVVRHGVGAVAAVLLFIGGALVWSLTEYWLHRTFFHWEPPGKLGERMHFLVHGVHHKWPKDKYRLVMPPAVSISLFFIFLGIFYPLLGARWVWPFHAGFTIGYMAYDLIHYYIHHYNPKSQYWLRLKKHHMLHHFKTPDVRYGVSSKFWDFAFGTVGEQPARRAPVEPPAGS